MITKTLNEGGGYKIRAIRKTTGTFEVIAIDWEHPNYGYFADAMIWIWSPHMIDWMSVPVVAWSKEYKTVSHFIKDYPDFADFFKEIDSEKFFLKSVSKGKHKRMTYHIKR